MYRTHFLLMVLMLIASIVIASPLRIEGKIKGANGTKEIYLYPDKSFGEFEKLVIPLYQQGIFSIDVDISYPQLAVLGVNGNYLKLYLSPGANIILDADAIIFPQGINYAGSGGSDNYMLQKFYEIEPPIREFDKHYYRIFGHQFPFTTQVEGYMRLYHPDEYREKLEAKQARMNHLLEDPKFATTTSDFQCFLNSEVSGFLHYNLLAYTLLYAKREGVEVNYFNLDRLPSGDVNSDYYRNYLILNNMYMSSLSDGKNPRAQTCYRLAQNFEEGYPLQYLLAEVIVNAVRKGDEETLMLFEEYLNQYPSSPFLKRIDRVIYKENALFTGEMAPDFFLPTVDGGNISLSQFKGKVVYIDYWASWCKPCIDKLDKLEKEKRNHNSDDIVFLTISIDGNQQIWKNTLEKRGYTGVHLFAGKSSTVLKDYKVKGIPTEFIIKKNGQFAPTPEDANPENLIRLLKRLNGGSR